MGRQKQEFSKKIMQMEMALLWLNTVGVLALAYYCVYRGFDTAFPWLTPMVSLPWAAWGVSKTGYTMKSTKENTSGGITYDIAMRQAGEQAAAESVLESIQEKILRDL